MPPVSADQQTSLERFLHGVAHTGRWFAFVVGCASVLPTCLSLFYDPFHCRTPLALTLAGTFGVFLLGTVVTTAVKSGALHGWAAHLELRGLLRREEQVNKLLAQYQDKLERRQATAEVLRELNAPSETQARIEATTAELARLRAQRQRLMQAQ